MTRNSDFLNITAVSKNGEVYEQNLIDDLVINYGDINESYLDQPGKYAWWAVLAAQARAKAEKLKAAVESHDEYMKKTLIGELDAEVRKTMEIEGEKITENKVTNGIYIHPRYVKALEVLHELRDKYVQANEEATILEAAREAFNQRKEMLISLGAQLRNDLSNTELTMKKKQVAEAMKNRSRPPKIINIE